MIQQRTCWLPQMVPNPRNPHNDQEQQNCCKEQKSDPYPCLNEMSDLGMQNQSECSALKSPDLQVNSEIINPRGLHIEQQNMSLDLEGKNSHKQGRTIGNLIQSISFQRKKQIKKNKQKQKNLQKSETSQKQSINSFSSGKAIKVQQSKCWNQEQSDLFYKLVQKYGTDFNFIKQYFPKKSKSQIKNKYKQMMNLEKKMNKKQERRQKGNKKEELLMVPNLAEIDDKRMEIQKIKQEQSENQWMK